MKKIDLRWLGECSPKHRRYSLMFAEHLVTIADCSLRWSVIYRQYFCDALVNISEALAKHPEHWGGGGGGGGRGEEGGGGRGEEGVDLYKFLSWFMSVIFLYYFTCFYVFLRFYVFTCLRVLCFFHACTCIFCCLLLFVQCTELMGYYTIIISIIVIIIIIKGQDFRPGRMV